MEEQRQEDPGFSCLFAISDQLPHRIAQGKNDNILQEGNMEFGCHGGSRSKTSALAFF